MLKKFLSSDLVRRALKTFAQAFVAALAVSNAPLSKSALLAACASAVSVVWNTVILVRNR